jgi:hypothetical protein
VTGPASDEPDLPLYFLHIPRTAGTSFTEELDRRFPAEAVYPSRLLYTLREAGTDELARYRLFRGHLGTVLPRMLDWRVRIVTVLRDPLLHVCSILAYVRQQPWHPLHERPAFAAGGTLAEQLRDDLFCAMYGNFQAWALVADPAESAYLWRDPPTSADLSDWRRVYTPPDGGWGSVWGPDAVVTAGDDAALWDRATSILGRVETVGVTEHADEAMALLSRRMGWPAHGPLPVRNPSLAPFDPGVLTAADRGGFRERFAVDLELYALARRRFAEDRRSAS